jgi:hypothetical protein
MLIESDAMELAFRNKVEEWLDLGRYVDGEALEKNGRREVYVAPSPTRSADPKGWVHQTLPTLLVKKPVSAAE